MSHQSTGEFAAKVSSLLINISETNPFISTRLTFTHEGKEERVSHTILLNKKPENIRIGLDELRSAFPQQLANLDNEALVTKLIEETDSFTGLPVQIAIEHQRDRKTGVTVKNPKTGEAYFNVRLRSGVRNLAKPEATSLAKRLLSLTTRASMIEESFADAKPVKKAS